MARDEVNTELVQQDPSRALPESYAEIVANIASIQASANGNWYRIAKFPKVLQAHNHRGTLRKRPEYARFAFKAGRLVPAEEGYEGGLWCKWIGVRKPKRDAAIAETPPEEAPRRLRSVRDG